MKVFFRRGHPARTARPVQFANSWINVDYTDGDKPGPRIVVPSQVQLEHESEFRLFATTNRAAVGNFWRMWQLNPDGTFARLNPAPLRRRQMRRGNSPGRRR